jgi:hypothetical protein
VGRGGVSQRVKFGEAGSREVRRVIVRSWDIYFE